MNHKESLQEQSQSQSPGRISGAEAGAGKRNARKIINKALQTINVAPTPPAPVAHLYSYHIWQLQCYELLATLATRFLPVHC